MSPYGHLPMRDAYFAPERVKREGGIDPLFRGAVKQAAQEIDLKVWSEILLRWLTIDSSNFQHLH